MRKLIIVLIMILALVQTAFAWCNISFSNQRNITVMNTTETPDDYPIVFSVNETHGTFGYICGIRIFNSTCDEISFGYQDNGNTTIDNGENITFRVSSFPTDDYIIAYTNITEMNCGNTTFNDVRYNLWDDFNDDSLDTSKWTASVYDSCAVSETGQKLEVVTGNGVNYDRCGVRSVDTFQAIYTRMEWQMRGQSYIRGGFINNTGNTSANDFSVMIWLHGDTNNATSQIHNDTGILSESTEYKTYLDVDAVMVPNMMIINKTHVDAWNITHYQDTNAIGSINWIKGTNLMVTLHYLCSGSRTGYYDNFYLRYYTNPEPTNWAGSEETNTMIIDDCSEFNNTLITMNLYNETTFSVQNGTLEASFEVFDNNNYPMGNFSFKFEDNSSYSMCSFIDGVYQTNAIMQYYVDDSPNRNYYLRNATLNTSNPSNITLYPANEGKVNDVIVTVYDSTYIPKEDAIVISQKFNIPENEYFTVAMLKTDFDGEGTTYLETENDWYKFFVTDYSGTTPTTYTFSPKQIYYDSSVGYIPVELVLGESEELTYVKDFSYNCTSYEQGDQTIIRCYFTNTQGLHSNVCLEVFNATSNDLANVTSTCTSDVTATLWAYLQNTTASYFYRFLYTSSDSGITYLVDSGYVFVNIMTGLTYPLFTIFVMMTMVGMLSLLMVWKPEMAIMSVPVSVLVTGKVFQYNISLGFVSAFLTLGALFLSKVND